MSIFRVDTGEWWGYVGGGDEMTKRLDELMERSGGIIRTRDATEAGISRASMAQYAERGHLERVCHGIYAAPDTMADEAYIMSLRYPGAVFSHGSALYLNGLAERLPVVPSATFETNKLPAKAFRQECRCFSIAAPLHQLGACRRRTPFGREVPCYNAERTICDLLRSRSRCDEETVISALKNYAGSGTINAPLLADYADRLGIMKTLKPYMEVLL